ncbi:MAG: hypothetical protein FIA99_06460 [Ruminiclostridium sp.]|nr:hypothetical protein [Ruminiclostridium sp.]
MNFWYFIYLYYTIIVCLVILVLFWRNPKRIKELFPTVILGFVVQFLTEEFLINAGLYQFPNAFLPIFGIPLCHLLWGAGGAIVVMYFIPRKFLKKLFVILIFTVITLMFEYIPEHVGKAEHLGKYNMILDAMQDYLSLIVLVFFSEGLFGKRIHPKDSKLQAS